MVTLGLINSFLVAGNFPKTFSSHVRHFTVLYFHSVDSSSDLVILENEKFVEFVLDMHIITTQK